MEFVLADPGERRFETAATVRLGDADARGLLRVDALARYLQDVATDDWNDTGLANDDVWLVRRTALRAVPGTAWPRYLERVGLATWCGGSGPAWAERRTDVFSHGRPVIETVALWVPTDPEGRPVRMREEFYLVYGEAARTRRVSSRVEVPAMTPDPQRRPWSVRVADLDLVGHVNNAAAWAAVTEVAPLPLASAVVTHHGSLELTDEVELVVGEGVLWLCVEGEVRVSATYSA